MDYKKLVINKRIIARYEIGFNNIIYIKIYKKLNSDLDDSENEHHVLTIISIIEGVLFESAGILNIS
jgi:hypothetical protein